MAGGTAFRAFGILSCSLLLLEMAAAGGVHRCEDAEGLVTYSDTGCATEPHSRDRVDEPTPESASATPSDKSDTAEPEWTHDRARQEYEQRRQALIGELDDVDLGPGQEASNLLENKARHEFLVREFARLDARWREYAFSGGARQRPEERDLGELKKRLRRLERRREYAIEYTRVHFGEETYTCQWAHGEVSCW